MVGDTLRGSTQLNVTITLRKIDRKSPECKSSFSKSPQKYNQQSILQVLHFILHDNICDADSPVHNFTVYGFIDVAEGECACLPTLCRKWFPTEVQRSKVNIKLINIVEQNFQLISQISIYNLHNLQVNVLH